MNILFCFSKYNWELQQTINKENELSRNSPFSHSAATILVKRAHPHQNIAPLTSRRREDKAEKKRQHSWFNSITIYEHILMCYFNTNIWDSLGPYSLSLTHLAKCQLQMTLFSPFLHQNSPVPFSYVPVRLYSSPPENVVMKRLV